MKKYLILGLFSLLLVAGCGEKSTHTDSYYFPSFNKDGSIVVVRGITTSQYNMIDVKASESYHEYIEVMDKTGATENVYDDVTADNPINLVANPVNNQIAFGADLRLNLFNKIVIMTVPTPSSGAARIEINVSRVRSFDWDAAGTHIIYCNDSGEIRQVNLDGSGDTLITSDGATAVFAKYGSRIFYTYSDSGVSKLAYWDGSARTQTGIANVSNLCVSKVNTNEVYCQKSTAYEKLDLSAAPVTETVKITGFTGTSPFLSPAANSIVYYDNGVWVSDFAGNKTKVK